MSCHQVSKNKHIIWPVRSQMASAEQKKNRRRARVHAAINMSESFSENVIMDFVIVTHSADSSHNYMTLREMCCP